MLPMPVKGQIVFNVTDYGWMLRVTFRIFNRRLALAKPRNANKNVSKIEQYEITNDVLQRFWRFLGAS